jgi:hypothetical protein
MKKTGGFAKTLAELSEGKFLFGRILLAHAPQGQGFRPFFCPTFDYIASEVEVFGGLLGHDE